MKKYHNEPKLLVISAIIIVALFGWMLYLPIAVVVYSWFLYSINFITLWQLIIININITTSFILFCLILNRREDENIKKTS